MQQEKLTVKEVKGYLDEVENPDSVVETYAAIKLFINNAEMEQSTYLFKNSKKTL